MTTKTTLEQRLDRLEEAIGALDFFQPVKRVPSGRSLALDELRAEHRERMERQEYDHRLRQLDDEREKASRMPGAPEEVPA